jgi:hypothetical protein
MNNEIKVDTEAFQAQSDAVGVALGEFRSYSLTFANEASSQLYKCNSTFVDRLKKVLKHLEDDAGPELLADIEDYQRNVALIADGFRQVDDGLAEGM